MSKPTKGVIDKVRGWMHDHLTVSGREEQIYLNQYQQVLEKAAVDLSPEQFSSMEQQLRQKAHSSAVGSMVLDGLVAGGALVGTGAILSNKDTRKYLKKFIQNKRYRSGAFKGSTFRQAELDKIIMKPIDATLKVGKFGMDVVKAGGRVIFWPARQVGKAGEYLWKNAIKPTYDLTAKPLVDFAASVPGAVIDLFK